MGKEKKKEKNQSVGSEYQRKGWQSTQIIEFNNNWTGKKNIFPLLKRNSPITNEMLWQFQLTLAGLKGKISRGSSEDEEEDGDDGVEMQLNWSDRIFDRNRQICRGSDFYYKKNSSHVFCCDKANFLFSDNRSDGLQRLSNENNLILFLLASKK